MGEETEEEATPTAVTPKDWKQNFSVKESKEVEKVERLSIVVGVNEYKGQHLVFLAKVTDKNFSRQFFSMPAFIWEKTVPALQEYIGKIAEIERASLEVKALEELRRLASFGVDVKALLKKV